MDSLYLHLCIFTIASLPILVQTDMKIMKSFPKSLATKFNNQPTYYNEFNLGQNLKKLNVLT